MAKVIAIGQPVNDSERQAIAHLRDHLPDTFTILHNFEIQRVMSCSRWTWLSWHAHAVYLVDAKGHAVTSTFTVVVSAGSPTI
ncbi:MAG: hypothetical protein R3C56_37065 [Pirellulaceae bacterium]